MNLTYSKLIYKGKHIEIIFIMTASIGYNAIISFQNRLSILHGISLI